MLTIYGVPISVHTRKVIATAKLKGFDFTVEPVIPFNPPDDWRSMSPTGLIPAISHGDYRLADSNAICAYLEQAAPTPPIYPTDAKGLGRALWLEQYGTSVLFSRIVHPLFFQKIIRPHVLKQGDPDEAAIGQVLSETVPGVFGYLENQIAGDFLVNGALTIADITVASNLLNFQYLGFRVDGSRYPKLAASFAHTIRQSAFRDLLASEEPFAAQMGLDRSFLN
jgi:glutathione S-transferase